MLRSVISVKGAARRRLSILAAINQPPRRDRVLAFIGVRSSLSGKSKDIFSDP